MMKKFLLRTVAPEHAKKIVDLFKKSYHNNYLDKRFMDESTLRKLLQDTEHFLGMAIISSQEEIWGFCGAHIKINPGFSQIYLANLVVDKEYRGLGFGKLLESFRLITVTSGKFGKVTLHGLVHQEKAPISLHLKEEAGFTKWGVRLFYGLKEPGNIGQGHLVLFGKIRDLKEYDENMSIEDVQKVTQTVIEKNSSITRRFIRSAGIEFKGKADYIYNPDHGQVYCHVSYDPMGENITGIIKKF